VAYRILWSDSALERTAEFFDFIAEDNPAAARRTVQGLFDRVQALAEHPLLGRRLSQDIDSNLRRLVVGSYVVIYQVNKARKKVDIVAVRHHRQRPLPQEEP
jgi:plasmid stabilization system protein ParE